MSCVFFQHTKAAFYLLLHRFCRAQEELEEALHVLHQIPIHSDCETLDVVFRCQNNTAIESRPIRTRSRSMRDGKLNEFIRCSPFRTK